VSPSFISVFVNQANDEPITADDIVQANLRAATTDAVGEAYNIGTGTETTVLDLAETIQQATDTDSATVHTDPRPADIDHNPANIAKARKRLGYEPRLSLHEGVESLAARGDWPETTRLPPD
jgi:UDP-glucose 4-epimerase